MTVSERQQARKRTEREPVDWKTYYQSLIDSGMVAEAHERTLNEQRTKNPGGMTDDELMRYNSQMGGLQQADMSMLGMYGVGPTGSLMDMLFGNIPGGGGPLI